MYYFYKLVFMVFCTTQLFANSNSTNVYFKFYSDIRAREYEIVVRFTPNFNSNRIEKYKSIYFQDGFAYLQNIKTYKHIDTLYNLNKIDDFVSVYIQPSDRSVEFLIEKEEFAKFISLELVPFIDKNYNTSTKAEDRTMIGLSYGGNVSAYICYNYSNIFGNCGLQSAAFRPTFDVFQLFENGEKKEIVFYAVWGTEERPIGEDMIAFQDNLLAKGYSFIGEQHEGEGHTFSFWSSTIQTLIEYFVDKEDIVGVNTEPINQIGYSLSQNYPNPFNPSTTISYTLPNESFVKLSIFDLAGKEIDKLVNEKQTAGKYKINFDGSNLPSGIYFYQITMNKFTETKKLVVLR